MSTFSEDQVRRDGSGKFAEKGPAPEAGGIDLSARPNVNTAQVKVHEESVSAYDAEIAEAQARIDAARTERSRHALAGLAVANPDATYVRARQDYSDSGSKVLSVATVYSFDGHGEGAWRDPEGSWDVGEAPDDAWKDFELDSSAVGGGRIVDLSKVRSWSTNHPIPVSKLALDREARERADQAVEYALVKDVASTARERFPDARYVEVSESDSDYMSYDRILDAEGRVLHSSDPDEVERADVEDDQDEITDDQDEITDDMNDVVTSLDCRSHQWTDACADDPAKLKTPDSYYETKKIWRDKHSGGVRSATIDLDRAEAL